MMADHQIRSRCIGFIAWAAAIVLMALLHAGAGKPIYTYVDARGVLVVTDRWEDIPERYRGRVKVSATVGAASPRRASDVSPTLDRAEDKLVQLVDRLPTSIIPGLSSYQSVMLISGFLTVLLFYGSARLANNSFLRLLMPWAVGFATLATLYLMFVADLSDKVAARAPTKSSGSLVHQFQETGKHIGEQKEGRLKQFDQTADRE